MSSAKTNQYIQCITLSMVPFEHRGSYAKYDADHDGVIESFNSNGENELEKISEELHIEFSEEKLITATKIKFRQTNIGGTYDRNTGKYYRNNVFETTIYQKGGKEHTISINDDVRNPYAYRENGRIVKGNNDSIFRSIVNSRDTNKSTSDPISIMYTRI